MQKILTQEEIDTLLKGVQGGAVDTTPSKVDASGVVPYDFTKHLLDFQTRLPTLTIVNDLFSRSFRNNLSKALRRIMDVNPRGVQIQKFNDFIKTLPLPTSMHIFSMDPLRGNALLVLESKLIFKLLDLFFGGSGKKDYPVEGREFTVIESRMIHKVVAMAFTDLEKAWSRVHPIKFQYIRSEMNPQYVSIATSDDLVLTIHIEVGLDDFNGRVTLCLPYFLIEPIKAKLSSGQQIETFSMDQNWIERFLDDLKSVEVEVKAEIGRCPITVQELLGLKVGDVFSLKKEISSPLGVDVQGVRKFLGRAGVYGTNQAVQIDGRIENS
ncbi:MAG TPA: flagellar motor switch protein FliM [Thermodesulfobacteriota bacterium]|nr:flagellar motor switch protein FliM [Thermodesulfobacteriota bacterium]